MRTTETSELSPALASGLREPQLAGLDAIRAIAALLVILYHFGVPRVSGGLGVLMFFVLSGFLITWLLLREHDEQGSISLRDFYIRRSLRIFPAFYCYAAVLLALIWVRHTKLDVPQAWAALFYYNNYYQAINGDPDTGFSHTWSLAVEEQFYLLWPMLFLLLRGNLSRMMKVLAVGIVGVWIYRGLLVFVFKVHQGYIYEAFDTRVDHLMTGCLLAVALRAGVAGRFWNWITGRQWLALITAGLLFVSNLCETVYGHQYRDSISFIANPLLTAILIPQLIAFRHAGMWRWTNWTWVRYLGRISYSVYLYQQLLIGVPRKLLPGYSPVLQLAATVLLIIAVASLSYKFVEQPCLRLKTRFRRTVAGATV